MKIEKSLSFVFVLLIISLAASGAAAKMTRENREGYSERRQEKAFSPEERDSGEGDVLIFGKLFQGVEIHSPLGDEFNGIYSRNRAEIHRIVDQNPGIIWDTLGLVLDLLPALRSVDQNGGKLYVEKQVLARATDLYWKCESMASPRLAGDLRRAKTLVESRMTELNSHQLLIDLNQ